MQSQLKTSIWVSALLRRAQIAGASGFVMAKGDPDAGIVLVKISTLDGLAMAYFPERNYETGARVWRASELKAERDIDAQILARAAGDPDIWRVEIEDKEGRSFLTEKISPTL